MIDEFTSTGKKLAFHTDAMNGLRDGTPRPITAHVMPTDVCQHHCKWCSVSERAGDTLPLESILGFVDQLVPLGLKSVIISGGGNPILYPAFNEMVFELASRGIEAGLICNGMALRDFSGRQSWKNVLPRTLDYLTWCRISMSGLDHPERTVYVPDFDRTKTTLGFSYVYAGDAERLPWLRDQISELIFKHNPRYVRLLPNCLEVDKIEVRCDEMRAFAASIDPSVCFVQYKPPQSPDQCFLGYVHPVLTPSGYVFPCDSCVLNDQAGHTFAEPWRMCHWSEIGEFYRRPVKSLIDDPHQRCPGCVFSSQNRILIGVRNGVADRAPSSEVPEHVNFV